MTIGNIAQSNLQTSMIRISTGQRINSAADDAAGLGISERMSAQITGLDRGTQNVMDMQNLIRTAEGGLSNISDSLHRIRELTVQSLNGVLTDTDRQNIQFEIDALIAEIDDVTHRTEFNTMRLLDGSFNREDGRGLHTAADAMGRGPSVYIGNMSASMLLGPQPFDLIADSEREMPALVAPPEAPEDDYNGDNGNGEEELLPTPPRPTIPPLDSQLLQRVDNALTMVSRERSYLGAMENRFDTTIASNQIANLNLAAARSGIRDADIALESMRMEQQSILEQAQMMAERRRQEEEGIQIASLLA